MTETKPALAPLTLDDIRAAGPDRDNAEAFDPAETWATACDKVQAGYSAWNVAGLLLDLDGAELDALAEYWKAHTLATVDDPGANGRDFHCPDLRLAMALQDREPDREAWGCAPKLDPESLWQTVDDFDRMKAENAKLRELLAYAGDTLADWSETHVWDADAGEKPDPTFRALMGDIESILGDAGNQAPAPKPVRIVIGVEGGIVQGASADGPCSIVVVDYDTDGDQTALVVPQARGGTAEAWVNEIDAATDDEARAWVQAMHSQDGFQTVMERDAAEDDCTSGDTRHTWIAEAKTGETRCETCGRVQS